MKNIYAHIVWYEIIFPLIFYKCTLCLACLQAVRYSLQELLSVSLCYTDDSNEDEN